MASPTKYTVPFILLSDGSNVSIDVFELPEEWKTDDLVYSSKDYDYDAELSRRYGMVDAFVAEEGARRVELAKAAKSGKEFASIALWRMDSENYFFGRATGCVYESSLGLDLAVEAFEAGRSSK